MSYLLTLPGVLLRALMERFIGPPEAWGLSDELLREWHELDGEL